MFVTVSHPPNSPEAVAKVIDMLTQEGFHGDVQKLLEQYNKCIAAGGDYFEGDKSLMCVLSIKVPIRKKCGNLFDDPPIYIYIYIYKKNVEKWYKSPSCFKIKEALNPKM